MVCLACGVPCRADVCSRCRAMLVPAPDRLVGNGLFVRSAFRHEGPARTLIHRLKYQGVLGAGVVLAVAMAARLPPGAACLVPIPRVLARRWRYGVDQAAALAVTVGEIAGLPVVRALGVPIWRPPQAGRSRSARSPASFDTSTPLPSGSVLVDDVITTGHTLVAAADPGVVGALTATSATLRPEAISGTLH